MVLSERASRQIIWIKWPVKTETYLLFLRYHNFSACPFTIFQSDLRKILDPFQPKANFGTISTHANTCQKFIDPRDPLRPLTPDTHVPTNPRNPLNLADSIQNPVKYLRRIVLQK